MTTTLHTVLAFFEQADRPYTLAEAARALDLEPGILAGMIAHWARKGRLRLTADGTDTACGMDCGMATSPACSTCIAKKFKTGL